MNVKLKSDKKHILYLDTSDEIAVISLWQQDQKIKEIKWQAGRELSKTLSQKYSNVLQNVGISSRDLLGICVFVGPGSFTGLRIGISFANGLAFGLGIPVYETKKKEFLNLKNSQEIAVPFYNRPPRITRSKK